MMDGSLKDRAISGFIWMFGGTALQSVLKIAVLSVLARLLTPADFGLANAAVVAVAFGDIFAQLGVAPALVQRERIDATDIATGWLASILLGIVCGAACFLAAPFIAAAFRMPGLSPVIEWVAWIFPIRGASLVPEALLQRHMKFRQIAAANVIGYIAGYAAVALTLAARGWGVWSLVAGMIAQPLVTGLLLIGANGHSVLARPRAASFFSLMQFGAGLTLARIGSYISLNVDYFVAGRLLGVSMLGLYSRAFYFLQQPTTIFGSLADRVLFPAFASIQTDRTRITTAFLSGTGLTFILSAPAAGALAVIAPELLVALLGRQWEGAVVPFQCLIIALPFRVASKLQGTVLRSLGRVYIQAGREWSCALWIAAGAYGGAKLDSVRGLAIGVTLALLLNYLFGALSVRRVSGLSLGMQTSCMWRPVAWSTAIFGLIAVFRGVLTASIGPSATVTLLLVLVTVAFSSMILLAPRLYGHLGELLFGLAKERIGKSRR